MDDRAAHTAYMRAWRAAHPGYDRDRKRRRYGESPQLRAKQSLRTRRWKDAHPERVAALSRARTAAWRARNRETVRLGYSARRARAAGAVGSHSVQEWLDKVALLGGVCLYCGEARALTRDHKVPFSRGGTNDIANVVPACRPCNERKHNRTAQEFIARAA